MNKLCKLCGKEQQIAGFERKLITRGKDKGVSLVKYFYHPCSCKLKCTK